MNYKKLLIGLILLSVLFFLLLEAPFLYQQAKFIVAPPENTPAVNKNVKTPEQGEPNMLRIPSLGITAPIKYVEGEGSEDKYQQLLQEGVVHFPGTAEIGELGNAYIFGHSSDFAFAGGKYKTVFAVLPNIKNGAEIVVTNKQGREFTYIVTEQFVAEKNDVHLLDQNGYTKKQLTLQTSYPLGTALKRYIVLAILQE